jgi:hypothetical protein
MFRIASLLTLAAVTASLALAQVGGAGAIQGTVTDSSGGVVSGATVSASNVGTGVATSRQTTATGFYNLSPLPAGEYTVTVTAPGFQTLTQQHVVVDALATVAVNPKLQVGAQTQSVTVVETPPALKTEDATLGSTMRNETYAALPLAMNGVPRDPTQFVNLVPGVNSGATQAAGTSYASFNGGQTYQNEVYVEGIPVTDAGAQGDTRTLSLGISVEAVDQFQVETNGAKAQYEGQGVENYVLKSGGDQFHAAAYEYFRNTDLDARGFFPPTTPIEHQNEFGVNAGGPIRKDKIFYFADYDGYRYDSGEPPQLQSVPTPAERMGDFSAFPNPIYDPNTTVCSIAGVCTRTQFPGNIIPANRLSKVAQSLQSYLPAPTNGNITNNYLASLPIINSVNNVTAKVDVNQSDRNRFYGVYSTGKYTTNFTGSLATGTDSLPLPYTDARTVEEYTTLAQLHDTYVINASTVNQISYSYNRLFIPLVSNTASGNYPQKAGLTGLPPGIASQAFPDVTFNGTNAPISWAGTNSHVNTEAVNTFVLQDNVLLVKGNHSLTLGFQFQALQDNYNNPLTGTLAGFTFSSNETASFSPTGSILGNTGNSYASYLLGAVDSSSVTQNSVAETGGRYHDYAAYIQDDWKVTPKLTVNLGLRYDLWTPFAEVDNRMSFLNPLEPNAAAGGHLGALEFAGSGPDSCNCTDPIKTHYLNFGPRLGAAYRLGDKTVFRAGYSITYVHAGGVSGRANARQGLSQLGFNTSASFASIGNGTPAFYLDNGYPAYQVPPFLSPTYGTGFITSNPTGAQSPTYGDYNLGGKPPYYENWNFGVQRGLTNSITLGLNYSASSGHFLPGAGVGILGNAIPDQYLSLGSLLTTAYTPASLAAAQKIFPNIAVPFPNFVGTIGQMLRPFPQYGAIGDPWGDTGNSTYNALQVNLNRRFSNGFTFMLAYTYSKELDDLGGNRDLFNNSLEKSLGTIDHPHVFTGTFVYSLPFGKGHKMGASNKVVSSLVSGWQFSGIVTFSSGAPLTFTANGCTSGGILGTCYPNYAPGFTGSVQIGTIGDGNLLGSSPTVFYNKAAFTDPAPFTVGNVPRTAPYGLFAPSLLDEDLSIHREFALRERLKLSLQADAFNITNSAYFSAPGTNIDAASFGTITSQNNLPRKFQFNARLTF